MMMMMMKETHSVCGLSPCVWTALLDDIIIFSVSGNFCLIRSGLSWAAEERDPVHPETAVVLYILSPLTRWVLVLLQSGQKLWDGLLLGLSDVAEVLTVQNQEKRLQVRNQPSQNWGENSHSLPLLQDEQKHTHRVFMSGETSRLNESIHFHLNQLLRTGQRNRPERERQTRPSGPNRIYHVTHNASLLNDIKCVITSELDIFLQIYYKGIDSL